MNPTALPTPFDIVPPPPVAYVPGTLEWICVALVLAVALTVALMRRPKPKHQDFAPLQACLRSLNQLKPEDPDVLIRLQMLLKALISQITGDEMRSLTAREIATSAAQCKSIASVCAQIELATYRCDSSIPKSNDLLSAAKNAVAELAATTSNTSGAG